MKIVTRHHSARYKSRMRWKKRVSLMLVVGGHLLIMAGFWWSYLFVKE